MSCAQPFSGPFRNTDLAISRLKVSQQMTCNGKATLCSLAAGSMRLPGGSAGDVLTNAGDGKAVWETPDPACLTAHVPSTYLTVQEAVEAGHTGILVSSDASMGSVSAAGSDIRIAICAEATLTGGAVVADSLLLDGSGTFSGEGATVDTASTRIRGLALASTFAFETSAVLDIQECTGTFSAALTGAAPRKLVANNTFAAIGLSGTLDGIVVTGNAVTGAIAFEDEVTSASITQNTAASLEAKADVTESSFTHNTVTGAIAFDTALTGANVSHNRGATMDFGTTSDSCSYTDNDVTGAITFAGDLDSSDVSQNTAAQIVAETSADDCTFIGNQVTQDLTITEESTRCVVSNNAVTTLTLCTDVDADMQFFVVTGNGAVSFTFGGSNGEMVECAVADNRILNTMSCTAEECSSCTFTGNVVANIFSFTGDEAQNVTITGNYVGSAFSVGDLGQSDVSNNNLEGAVFTVSGDCERTTFVGNQIEELRVEGDSDELVISGNILNDVVLFSGLVSEMTFTGNLLRSGCPFTIGDDADQIVFSDNYCGGVVTFAGSTLQFCIFNGNRFEGAFIVDGTATSCGISNNYFVVSCTVGTDAATNPTVCVVTGNNAVGAISTSGTTPANTNTVTGNHATGGFAGWSTFATDGYPNDLLDTGVAPIVAGVGLNRV